MSRVITVHFIVHIKQSKIDWIHKCNAKLNFSLIYNGNPFEQIQYTHCVSYLAYFSREELWIRNVPAMDTTNMCKQLDTGKMLSYDYFISTKDLMSYLVWKTGENAIIVEFLHLKYCLFVEYILYMWLKSNGFSQFNVSIIDSILCMFSF